MGPASDLLAYGQLLAGLDFRARLFAARADYHQERLDGVSGLMDGHDKKLAARLEAAADALARRDAIWDRAIAEGFTASDLVNSKMAADPMLDIQSDANLWPVTFERRHRSRHPELSAEPRPPLPLRSHRRAPVAYEGPGASATG